MWTREVRRRRITWLAIAGYVVVASGLPLPMGAVAPTGSVDATATALLAAKDRSRPFPCRDKPCGCVSADQCFTKCCCNTPAETLAWARAHAVEPAVLAALERRVAAAPPAACRDTAATAQKASCCSVVKAPQKASCCATATRPACCATEQATTLAPLPDLSTADAVCHDAQSPVGGMCAADGDDAAIPPDDTPASCRGLVLRAMLACGGIVAEWFSIGAAPPPLQVVAGDRNAPPAGVVVLTDERREPRAVVPDVPPPRAA